MTFFHIVFASDSRSFLMQGIPTGRASYIFFDSFLLYVLSFLPLGHAGSSLLHGPSLAAESGGYFGCSVWALVTVASPVTERRLSGCAQACVVVAT